MSLSLVGFSSGQDDTQAFTMHFIMTLRSFPKAAFEAVPMMQGKKSKDCSQWALLAVQTTTLTFTVKYKNKEKYVYPSVITWKRISQKIKTPFPMRRTCNLKHLKFPTTQSSTWVAHITGKNLQEKYYFTKNNNNHSVMLMFWLLSVSWSQN